MVITCVSILENENKFVRATSLPTLIATFSIVHSLRKELVEITLINLYVMTLTGAGIDHCSTQQLALIGNYYSHLIIIDRSPPTSINEKTFLQLA